jgi:hypothetical protein
MTGTGFRQLHLPKSGHYHGARVSKLGAFLELERNAIITISRNQRNISQLDRSFEGECMQNPEFRQGLIAPFTTWGGTPYQV